MRKLVLPLAILAMAGLLGAAVVIDCVRLARSAQHRVELADAEMAKNEIRLVKQLEGNAKTTTAVSAAIEHLKSIHGREARMAGYDSLVASYRNTMSGTIDADNLLDRKYMDDAAGAMNRRDVAQKQYEEELGAYQVLLSSWRGRIAQMFSTAIR